MEFQQIFTTIVVILIGTVGFMSWFSYEGTAYYNNSSYLVTPELQAAASNAQSISNNITGLGNSMANSTQVPSGGGQITSGTSQSTLLVTRGLNTITLLPQILTFIPSLTLGAAAILGVPYATAYWAIVVFGFGFAILLAYLIVVGVRRII
jgi:uncharacterized protein (UPF0333 family)